MCTVVVRWTAGSPILLLALRDELTDREFDDPGPWWPDQPTVLGGRDRAAGGSWCVTDVPSGSTALVLNRTQRPVAEPAAPSRGVLPLLAVRHGTDWPAHLDVSGMASFAVLLAAPQGLTAWEFDGSRLTRHVLPPGTHMLTAGAAEQGRADRHLTRFLAVDSAEQWRTVVTSSAVEDHAASLLVRHEHAGSTFATVFAQVLEAEPGRLTATYSRTPTAADSWLQRRWPSDWTPSPRRSAPSHTTTRAQPSSSDASPSR